jgi:hypothetical protein
MEKTMRIVTEKDFRKEEYIDEKPEDYEFRDDGVLVRKDRWLRAVFKIGNMVGISTRSLEIPEVIDALNLILEDRLNWNYVENESPSVGSIVSIKLGNGSVLKKALCEGISEFQWMGMLFCGKDVIQWRGDEGGKENPNEW